MPVTVSRSPRPFLNALRPGDRPTMTDVLAVIYVLLLGALLVAAILFDARRRRARRTGERQP